MTNAKTGRDRVPESEPYEDEFACVDDYPEHDYELFDEADGERVLHCRRCGAETVEESDPPPETKD